MSQATDRDRKLLECALAPKLEEILYLKRELNAEKERHGLTKIALEQRQAQCATADAFIKKLEEDNTVLREEGDWLRTQLHEAIARADRAQKD